MKVYFYNVEIMIEHKQLNYRRMRNKHIFNEENYMHICIRQKQMLNIEKDIRFEKDTYLSIDYPGIIT